MSKLTTLDPIFQLLHSALSFLFWVFFSWTCFFDRPFFNFSVSNLGFIAWTTVSFPGFIKRLNFFFPLFSPWLLSSSGTYRFSKVDVFLENSQTAFDPPPLPIFGNYIALFFAKIRKYALTCVNLQ